MFADAESLSLPPVYHLATIVLQDAACTIVDLPEPRERAREGRGRGYWEICRHSNRRRTTSDVKARAGREKDHMEALCLDGREASGCISILHRPASVMTGLV